MYSKEKIESVLRQLGNHYTSDQVEEVLHILCNNNIDALTDERALAATINKMSSDLVRLFLLITFQTLNRNQISQELSSAIDHLKPLYSARRFAQYVVEHPDTTIPENSVKDMDAKTRSRFFAVMTGFLDQLQNEHLVMAKQKYSFLAMISYLEDCDTVEKRVSIIKGFEVNLEVAINAGLDVDIVNTRRGYIQRLKDSFQADWDKYHGKE